LLALLHERGSRESQFGHVVAVNHRDDLGAGREELGFLAGSDPHATGQAKVVALQATRLRRFLHGQQRRHELHHRRRARRSRIFRSVQGAAHYCEGLGKRHVGILGRRQIGGQPGEVNRIGIGDEDRVPRAYVAIVLLLFLAINDVGEVTQFAQQTGPISFAVLQFAAQPRNLEFHAGAGSFGFGRRRNGLVHLSSRQYKFSVGSHQRRLGVPEGLLGADRFWVLFGAGRGPLGERGQFQLPIVGANQPHHSGWPNRGFVGDRQHPVPKIDIGRDRFVDGLSSRGRHFLVAEKGSQGRRHRKGRALARSDGRNQKRQFECRSEGFVLSAHRPQSIGRTFVLAIERSFVYGKTTMQRSFDDLGTPLHDVTFCVIDIETTGGSAQDGGITEIGAIKVRRGECLGTFQTMVNPGLLIPPTITMLTGITQAMVIQAPRIEAVLPALVEFTAGTVLVGHNVRYDLGYLNLALERGGYARFANRSVDTCALARRLVRDEVPNIKLGTLASRFRLDHQPSHRALDDALATADLLHLLIGRAATLGVMGLDDLIALPKLGNHPQVSKLKFTNDLPRSPGVYLFTGPRDEILYVGKATNLRERVRSYFSSDERRKIGNMLRETQGVRHIVCGSTLEASVTEVRLIHEHQPRYNRQSKDWRAYAYVKFSIGEAFPRLTVSRTAADDGALYLGPLSSTSTARQVIDAIHTVVPLRRCGTKLGPRSRPRTGLCTAAQLGVASCPCTGELDEAGYTRHVATVLNALNGEPGLLLGPLQERMERLAMAERFEEAADARDRAAALSNALKRQARLDRLRGAGRIEIELPGGYHAELRDGLLASSWHERDQAPLPFASASSQPGPLAKEMADELLCVSAWLDKEAHRIRLTHCDGEYLSPLRSLPSFEPTAHTRAG
jgi:DNA polymerase III subunit epsilon